MFFVHPRLEHASPQAFIRFIPGLDSDVLFQVQAMGDA
jgi:hypothetical protein